MLDRVNKGMCIKHKTKGRKYVVTTTKWRDRGGGRGFGNIYSRTVKFHCSGEERTGPGSDTKLCEEKIVNFSGSASFVQRRPPVNLPDTTIGGD